MNGDIYLFGIMALASITIAVCLYLIYRDSPVYERNRGMTMNDEGYISIVAATKIARLQAIIVRRDDEIDALHAQIEHLKAMADEETTESQT